MDFQTLRARDLMTTKIVCAEPHESLREAVRRMDEHRIHCLLVPPDRPGRGIGILTGKDCIQVLVTSGASALDELCVEDAMTRPAVTLPAGLCIEDCVQLMRHSGIRTAPVLEHDELAGILTFTDVLRALARGDV